MNITDTRLSEAEKALLAGMVGKEFEKIRCDEHPSGHSVYKGAGIYVGGKAYEIRNALESLDYFGDSEEVAVIGVREIEPGTSTSHLAGVKQVDEAVRRTVEDVVVYEDTQTLAENGTDTGQYLFTEAIVFVLAGTMVVFGKHAWFSEEITVARGPQADASVPAADELLEESEDPRFGYRAERKVISLHEWAEGR